MKTIPTWFYVVAGLGLIWNIYGVYQFIGSLSATEASLMAAGMTTAQATVMLNYPLWMTIAFAIGVFGGTIGTVLLLLRKRAAKFVFLISVIGYILLYVGDIIEGVFAALGTPQVIILTIVVLIAASLLRLTYFADKKSWLN